MILTQDLRQELMIDMNTGRRFYRGLSNEEIFNVLSDKYSEDTWTNAALLLDKLIEIGLSLEEILEYSFRREDELC